VTPYAIHPLTPDRWDDLETLFGPSGAYSGCWCMWWRQISREFSQHAGAGNRDRFRAVVAGGAEPGLLAYEDGEPVGWCAVCPRDELGRVLRSPTLKPTDDLPDVWAISCFFIPRRRRGGGIAQALLPAAVAFACERGAGAVEAYPVDTTLGHQVSAAELYTGTLPMFLSHGFRVVEPRRSARRVLVRRSCSAPPQAPA
jgi:GNAT superfamily N-acetyltransferase